MQTATQSHHFHVSSDNFQGPLPVLLDLIESRKLHISDISLATIADDFIAYVRRLEEGGGTARHAEHISEFVAIAATLLLIKARSLLPQLTLTQEEAQTAFDLEERLRQLQIVRQAAELLRAAHTHGPAFVLKETRRPMVQRFIPDTSIQAEHLARAVLELIATIPTPVKHREVRVIPTITIEVMMTRLAERIQKHMSTTLRETFGQFSDRKDQIVCFLAVLELFKRGVLTAKQEGRDSDIILETDTIHVPHYAG